MNSRPNILVIQADQLAARYLGAYQNPIASTLHIDLLAANELEQHCLCADKVYSHWAYQDILGYCVAQK
jgi:hypothetical protein